MSLPLKEVACANADARRQRVRRGRRGGLRAAGRGAALQRPRRRCHHRGVPGRAEGGEGHLWARSDAACGESGAVPQDGAQPDPRVGPAPRLCSWRMGRVAAHAGGIRHDATRAGARLRHGLRSGRLSGGYRTRRTRSQRWPRCSRRSGRSRAVRTWWAGGRQPRERACATRPWRLRCASCCARRSRSGEAARHRSRRHGQHSMRGSWPKPSTGSCAPRTCSTPPAGDTGGCSPPTTSRRGRRGLRSRPAWTTPRTPCTSRARGHRVRCSCRS
jgi:hypothetical protein